jgi:hypothetical protein
VLDRRREEIPLQLAFQAREGCEAVDVAVKKNFKFEIV